MEICRLYEVVKMWETALALTKPRGITKIKVSPIIKDDIQSMGEGDIYSYFKIYIEAEEKYTELIYGYDATHYRDDIEKKWAEETQILLLIEYMEDEMNDNYLNSFWEGFMQEVIWEPLPSV